MPHQKTSSLRQMDHYQLLAAVVFDIWRSILKETTTMYQFGISCVDGVHTTSTSQRVHWSSGVAACYMLFNICIRSSQHLLLCPYWQLPIPTSTKKRTGIADCCEHLFKTNTTRRYSWVWSVGADENFTHNVLLNHTSWSYRTAIAEQTNC